MKIKIFLPLLAVVIAGISAFAFTEKTVQKKFTPVYWEFTPQAPSTDPLDQENYTPFMGDPATFCDGDTRICVILATEDLSHPGFPSILGEPVESLIEQALQEGGSIPEDGIYLRD